MNTGIWLLVEELQATVYHIFSDSQKQPFEDVFQYRCSQELRNVLKKYSQKHIYVGVSLIKLQAFKPAIFLKRDSNTGVFFCECCEILENTFFYRTPLMAADWGQSEVKD